MSIRCRTSALLGLALFASPMIADAQPAPPVSPIVYTLRFTAAATHYVDVEAVVPAGRQPKVELMMAVWTPGSYLVREYARQVEQVVATDASGTVLPVSKSAKNRWTVTTNGAERFTLAYRVYSREMSVRTNWVDAGMGILNGAATFVTLVEKGPRPHEVKIELPPSWKDVAMALPNGSGGARHFVAADFDTLVDSPIIAGDLAIYRFDTGGKPHWLANLNEAGLWDGPRSATDTQKIVEANLKLWGSLPYPRYVFMNAIVESGGGLEHKDSTLLMTNRWRTRTRKAYLGWLGLVSHEFFHAWNVKRFRPVELGPFNYEAENYTTGLWISEGFTDYYGDLMVRRATLSSRDEYLEELSNVIRDLQTTPGRQVQSATTSSFDTWIKQYRPDENSPNTAISYYTKGAVVGFVLDAHIRALTSGAKSLDDVLRLGFQRFSGPRGFTQADFRKTASEVAGTDLTAWFAKHADTTDDIDYTPALDYFGLRFKPTADPRADKGWLGATTRNDDGRLVISQVRRGTPAFTAGLNVDDEILAIGDFRVRATQLDARLEQYRPGETVTVLVARRDQLKRIDVTLGAEPVRGWSLEVRADATPEQQARLKHWLWEM